MKKFFTAFLGIFMIIAGIGHFAVPEIYDPFIPDYLPEALINYGSGLFEIVIGIGLFTPAFRKPSALVIFILMILFLPLHVWDVFRDDPALQSHTAALIRLPVQFVLIYWAWWVWKRS